MFEIFKNKTIEVTDKWCESINEKGSITFNLQKEMIALYGKLIITTCFGDDFSALTLTLKIYENGKYINKEFVLPVAIQECAQMLFTRIRNPLRTFL